MKTTPTGELWPPYKKLTKGHFFHTALAYFQLKHPEKAEDMTAFAEFCEEEMEKW